MSSSFERVKEVLRELRGLDGAALDERLDELCAGDPPLRDEVRSLLPHCDSADARLDAPASRRELLQELLDDPPDGGAFDDAGDPRLAPATRIEGGLCPGARIGTFELRDRIGAGGMGVVYEAVQDAPRRTVALKLLAGDLGRDSHVERFEHEIQALGRLDHPGIAALYEAGVVETESGPRPWFAMQRVQGLRLDDWVRQERRTPEQVVGLFIGLCEAVAHAHERGVVHRDLKPGNVLVDDAGRPTVLDFGVARLVDPHTLLSSMHTQSGELIGTLPYMSPEQVSGQVEGVDPRSDVYSLGVMMFEALVGRLPIPTNGLSLPAAALDIRERDPPVLGDLDAELDGDLEVLVDTCLAKERSRRYATAGDLAADLRRLRDHRPLVARPLSAFEQVRRLVRRHRALTIGTSVAMLSLAVSLALSLHHAALSARDRDVALLEADRSRVSGAAAALTAHDPLTAGALLADVSVDGRGWEWSHLSQQLDSVARRLTAVERPLDAVLVEGGAAFLMVGQGGRLERRRVADDELVSSRDLLGPLVRAQLSADGGRVIGEPVAEPGRLVLWDTTDGERVAELDTGEDIRHVAVDRAGGRVLWLGTERAPRLWVPDAAPGARDVRRPRGERWERAVVAGAHFALVGVAGWVEFGRVDRFDDPDAHRLERISNERSHGPAIAPDGRRLAVASSDKKVVVFDLDTGDRVATLTGHTSAATALSFLGDSRRLLSAGPDGTLRLWDVDTGRLERAWASGLAEPHALQVDHLRSRAFARDGTGPVAMWDLEALDARSVLRGHERYVYSVDVDAEGARLVSGSWDGTARWWRLPDGTPAGRAPVDGRVELVASLDDGSTVAWAAGRLSVLAPDGHVTGFAVDGLSKVSDLVVWSDARLLIGSRLVGSPRSPAWVDLRTGEVTDAIDAGDRHVVSLDVSDDRSRLVTGTVDGRVDLWALPGGAWLRALSPHADRVNDVAFAPGRAHVVSVGWDGRALLHDLHDDAHRELGGHKARVHAAAWTPDGTRLATGSHDGLVRLFDPRDGALVAQLRGHEDYVHDLVFTPDGRVLASASGDRTIRLWHTTPVGETLMTR